MNAAKCANWTFFTHHASITWSLCALYFANRIKTNNNFNIQWLNATFHFVKRSVFIFIKMMNFRCIFCLVFCSAFTVFPSSAFKYTFLLSAFDASPILNHNWIRYENSVWRKWTYNIVTYRLHYNWIKHTKVKRFGYKVRMVWFYCCSKLSHWIQLN